MNEKSVHREITATQTSSDEGVTAPGRQASYSQTANEHRMYRPIGIRNRLPEGARSLSWMAGLELISDETEYTATRLELHDYIRAHTSRAALASASDRTQYFGRISKFPVLSRYQEGVLARAIERGTVAQAMLAGESDNSVLLIEAATAPSLTGEQSAIADSALYQAREAKTLFIECNLRLVADRAKRIRKSGIDFMDLVAFGNTGLDQAVDNFNWRKGISFYTYAKRGIDTAIRNELAEFRDTIRLPEYRRRLVGDLDQTEKELAQKLQREPVAEELAAALAVPIDAVRETMEAREIRQTTLLMVASEEQPPASATVEEDDSIDSFLNETVIKRVLETMGERSLHIISLRSTLGSNKKMSMNEIASRTGYTRDQVRATIKQATEIVRQEIYRDD